VVSRAPPTLGGYDTFSRVLCTAPVIGEPTFADAILDRLVHNAYRLQLDGPRLRKLRAKTDVAGTTEEDQE
jgi:hypothetical protein